MSQNIESVEKKSCRSESEVTRIGPVFLYPECPSIREIREKPGVEYDLEKYGNLKSTSEKYVFQT